MSSERSAHNGHRGIEQRAKRSRLGALDLLRLCAALSVVIYHYTGDHGRPTVGGTGAHVYGNNFSTPLFTHLYRVSQYGWLGVEIFFLISGFVICMSGWGRSLGEFFISRVTRLMPAYVVAVLLTFVVTGIWSFPYASAKPMTALTNLTMLQAPLGVSNIDDVYWTLWVELRFYLLFALVTAFGVTYRRIVLFCALWTVGSAFAVFTQSSFLTAVLAPTYSAYFIAGMAFYLMHRFRPTVLLWCIVGVSYAFSMHFLQAETKLTAKTLHITLPLGPALAIVTIGYALVGAIALGWFNWIRGAWTVTAGALTYPLYLVHEHIGVAMIATLHRHGLTPVACVAATIAAMLLLGWLLNRLVERPIAPWLKSALAKSLADIRNASPTAAAAPHPAGQPFPHQAQQPHRETAPHLQHPDGGPVSTAYATGQLD